MVAAGGLGGEVAAVAAHALVDDEHAGVGAVLADDVEGEAGALIGRGPGAQGLADRNHVVVDGLGQADDRELVVVLVEVGGQVGGGGVDVVLIEISLVQRKQFYCFLLILNKLYYHFLKLFLFLCFY